MRPNNSSKRLRGRSRSKSSNPLSRSYESNGPDVKIRGSALQVADKYAQLARDAQLSGDRVVAENYFQHAEHYYRIVAAAYEQNGQQQPRERRDDDNSRDDQHSRGNDQPSVNGYDGVDDDEDDDGVRRAIRVNGNHRADVRGDARDDRNGHDQRRDAGRDDTQRRGAGRDDTDRRDAGRDDTERRDAGRDDTERRDAGRDDTERRNAGRDDTRQRNAGRDDTQRRNAGRDDEGAGGDKVEDVRSEDVRPVAQARPAAQARRGTGNGSHQTRPPVADTSPDADASPSQPAEPVAGSQGSEPADAGPVEATDDKPKTPRRRSTTRSRSRTRGTDAPADGAPQPSPEPTEPTS